LAELSAENVKTYLSHLFDQEVELLYLGSLEKEKKVVSTDDVKGYGYGSPVLVEFSVEGKKQRAVLNTMRPGYGFGHDHFSDRAQGLILAHSSFNKLPRHVESIDIGGFTKDGELITVGKTEEFFQLVRYHEGTEYFLDLERIREEDKLADFDSMRAVALSDYLVDIHSVKMEAPELYVRRIRDLIGHGECIMGLMDSYPDSLGFIDRNGFAEIEKKCIDWRWKIKDKGYRLCQEHGDYHPWNILFEGEADLTVLDRSRGEWGEAADDIAAMSINYIFFSMQKHGCLTGPFEELYNLFMTNYLQKTYDDEMLTLIQPFYAWRALVIANPIWYPNLETEIRRKIFNFIHNILDLKHFQIDRVNDYLEG